MSTARISTSTLPMGNCSRLFSLLRLSRPTSMARSTLVQSMIPLRVAPPTKVRVLSEMGITECSFCPGFEGFTSSPDGTTLFALLQSAMIQDGGSDKTTNRYTRLLQYSVSANLVSGMVTAPQLVGEYIVPLPQSKKGKTYAQSEIHYLSPTTFLILARDGNGHGDDDTESSYKQIDLFSIASATNIAGTAFDSLSTPVAPGGVLNSAVTPATYVGFVDMLDDDQLDRFALHNGGDADAQLIDAKWESLALAPVGDGKNPDDYFLFAVVRGCSCVSSRPLIEITKGGQ